MGKTPAALGPVEHRPDPQERPKRMQREQAHPTCCVDRVLVRVVTPMGDFIGHIVDRNDPVKQRDDNEDEETQSEIIQEGVEIDALPIQGHSASNDECAQDQRRQHPFREPNKR